MASFNLERRQQRNQFNFNSMPQSYLRRVGGEEGDRIASSTTVIQNNIVKPTTITLLAGEDITAGQIVCLKPNDNVTDTGLCFVQKCDGSGYKTLGIALINASMGVTCDIQISGELDINFNLTDIANLKQYSVGTTIYCGYLTNGNNIADTIDLGDANVHSLIVLGVMIAPTKLLIDIQQLELIN